MALRKRAAVYLRRICVDRLRLSRGALAGQWPDVSSQNGLIDSCGFPKDSDLLLQLVDGTSPCCTCSRTGTGPNARARKSTSGFTRI